MLWAGLMLFAGCSPAVAPPAPPPTTAPPVATTSAAAPVASVPASKETPAAPVGFIEDDVNAALTRAKADGKLVFVDAWAPWCHTCLSMKHFVFSDPALSRFSDQVVFASVDTDRDENADFVQKYAIDVWPTLFVLEAKKGEVLGYWPGSASLREVEKLLSDALAVAEEQSSVAPGTPLARLLAGKRAQAHQKYAEAAQAYEQAVRGAPASWPRRSEALVGWIQSLHRARRAKECVAVGEKHAREVTGAAQPADFCALWLSCAKGLSTEAEKKAVRRAATERLEEIVASPPADASADDIADAWQILANARVDLGDKKGAREAHEKRIALLEAAAAKAPDPAAAATYDYGRAVSYMALGQGDKAIAMLEQREREIPDSYEPPARLASVLVHMKRWDAALGAVNRALAHAYGPRKLDYLELKERILRAQGNGTALVEVLEQQLAGWQEQAGRLKSTPKELSEVKARLEKARAANPKPKP